MAFVRSELSLMAYTGADTGHSFWFYANSEGDTLTDAGYFNDAVPEIRVGDLIYDVDGGEFVRVTAISGEGVATVAVVGAD